METGDVEVNIHSYFFINKAAKLPFEISRGSPQVCMSLNIFHTCNFIVAGYRNVEARASPLRLKTGQTTGQS